MPGQVPRTQAFGPPGRILIDIISYKLRGISDTGWSDGLRFSPVVSVIVEVEFAYSSN
ncbi:MAG: hypothetical protein NVSMB58_32450 [Terriglobales bacterium]